jgi:hypothetical protein
MKYMVCQILAGLVALEASATAQTRIDLHKQARSVDFSSAAFTIPFQSGTILPGLCSQGQVFFLTNAPAGANFYGCTSANTWLLEDAAAVSGPGITVGHSPFSISVDTSYLNTLFPQLGASNTFVAGSKQTFTPSATTEAMRLVCGSVPSAMSSGALFCTPGGVFGYFDGSVQKYPVVGTTITTATNLVFAGPSSGPAAVPGPRALVTADLPANGVNSSRLAAVNTRHVCSMIVGADNGPVLVNTDLGPKGRQCYVPYAATVVEIMVAGNAGVSSVIAGGNHQGTISSLTSLPLATAAGGGLACANTSGTLSLDGAMTCSNTLQNTPIAAGDWIELVSGSAGGVAKRLSVAVTYTVN